MINSQHILLVVLWITYCAVHSLLASAIVKRFFATVMHGGFVYYRICYSVFAFLTLAAILWFEFNMHSLLLFSYHGRYIAGAILGVPGLLIMAITIRIYFYELSGIQAIQNKSAQITLQQNGLHKYMRHPLYSGTLLLVWGLFIMMPQVNHMIACTIITLYTLAGIQPEEKKLIAEYGQQYIEYKKRVPMLIPHLLK
ncbi:hypothetical protein BH09BAC2_BH09BAC2_21790 [soil metagenome]